MMPAPHQAYDRKRRRSAQSQVAEQIAVLRPWDYRWAANSVATSLAKVFWAKRSDATESRRAEFRVVVHDYIAQRGRPSTLLTGGARDGVGQAHRRFGGKDALGQHHRFQRINDDIAPNLRRRRPEHSVRSCVALGLAGVVGAPARIQIPRSGIGTSGNSFVAVVEFGDRCTRAR